MTKRGFTLVEILIAAAVLAIGVLPLLLVNRSSNKLTMDAYYEFLATQLANEPIEVFRAVGYPTCATLPGYPVGRVETIDNLDGRYPPEATMFEREITLDPSPAPLCHVTVRVFPRAGSGAHAWIRQGKEAIIIRGVIPVVY